MLIALTGTPGTGKSTVSAILAQRYDVVDIHSYAESKGLFEGYDEDAGSYIVDVDRLNDSVLSEHWDGTVILDGHLSHFVDCDAIAVLRCRPSILASRLRSRGYDDRKVRENVQAEILDVILQESVDSGIPVYEFDTSSAAPEETADIIERTIILGESDDASPGRTDWSGEMEEWF